MQKEVTPADASSARKRSVTGYLLVPIGSLKPNNGFQSANVVFKRECLIRRLNTHSILQDFTEVKISSRKGLYMYGKLILLWTLHGLGTLHLG